MFTDTHTHLYDPKLLSDPGQITRAIEAGVTRMYMPNCDSGTIADMLALADQWPENCFPMMGLHPTYVNENYAYELDIMLGWLGKRRFQAIGEIGLDYYWDMTHVEEQKIVFRTQIDWALECALPIVIHSRESTADCIEIVREKQNGKLSGVFHCFGGTIEEAKAITELGFYLGIGGVATYKNSGLTEVLPNVPLEFIVLETDAPYLAPIPHRGKRNESAFIPVIADKLSDIYRLPVAEIARITTANAARLFSAE